MGFWDVWFGAGTSVKRINKKEFKKALKELPDLSNEERAYVEAAFGKELSDNQLTASEVRKRVSQLRKNYSDSLDSYEIEHLQEKLEREIENK
jgi:hypothetical protein